MQEMKVTSKVHSSCLLNGLQKCLLIPLKVPEVDKWLIQTNLSSKQQVQYT